MTTDLNLTHVLTLSPANAGIALAGICRALTPEQRVQAARSLTATAPESVHDFWLRTAAALLVQGRPSMSEGGGECLYRGPGGCACAVGLWIPDDLYSGSLEHQSLIHLVSRTGTLPWIADSGPHMIRAVQRSQAMHDMAATGKMLYGDVPWAQRLQAAARDHFAPEGAIAMIDAFVAESATP